MRTPISHFMKLQRRELSFEAGRRQMIPSNRQRRSRDQSKWE
jgi:hypothetical protein